MRVTLPNLPDPQGVPQVCEALEDPRESLGEGSAAVGAQYKYKNKSPTPIPPPICVTL